MYEINSKRLRRLSWQALYFVAIWFIPIWILSHFAFWVFNLYPSIRTQPYFLLDACKFYVCGLMARSPEYLPKLYDPDIQALVFGNLLHCGTTFTWPPVAGASVIFTPNEYTPMFNVLMIPCTYLSLPQFILIWEVLIFAFGTLSISIVIKRQGLLHGAALLAWWSIVFCSYHLYGNIFLGQTAFLITGLIGLFFIGLVEKRNWLIALSLNAIAIFKPQFAIVPLIAAWSAKRYKALVITVTIACLILAATGQVLGWQTLIDYPRNFSNIQSGTASGRFYYTLQGMGNFLSVLILVFGQKLGYKLSYPIMLIGWLCSLLIWRTAVKAGTFSYRYALAVTLPLALVTSAHANDFDLVILVIGWALTICVLRPSQIQLLKNPYERVWCWLFLLYPLIEQMTALVSNGGPLHIPLNLVIILSAYLLFRSKIAEPSAPEVEIRS